MTSCLVEISMRFTLPMNKGRGQFNEKGAYNFSKAGSSLIELKASSGFFTWINGLEPQHMRTKLDCMFGN